jgi:hypothetical protein
LISNQLLPIFSFRSFMKKSYTRTSGLTQRLRQLGLTALLAGAATVAAHAQFGYTAALATNVTGTFTDLGTTGTAIATANTDDANSAAQNIGFTFNYNGAAFTQFVLNTNGLIRLGPNAPSSAAAHSIYAQTPELGPSNSTNVADVNLIMPFNIDLVAGTATAGTSYRVAVTGTAPNRVCTIQWTNVSDKATNASSTVAVSITPQLDNFSFQVKLYETTNQIEFVYGPATAGVGTANTKYVAVGLKGSSSAAGQDLLATKASTALWSTTTFFSGPYLTSATGNAHNVRQTFPADAGRTYRFNVPAANDAAVAAVYTLGKIITPAGLPHAVRALVTNAGTAALTNLPVTLNVTGANTFTNTQTVATLAVGASATVTFANYPSTMSLGTNTVTVTVPSDANNTNNSASQSQLINSTTLSYIAPDQTTATAGGVGYGTGDGILASKFTLSAATPITSLSVYLPATANLAGHTMYAVVLSSTGTILGRSADYVVTAADVNTTKTLAITTPPTVPVGDFYAGIAQVASTTAFYPVGLQTETPTRTGAFYGFALTGGTPDDAASQNFGRFMIEALSVAPPACAAPTALAVTTTTATSATITFADATTAGSYQVVYGPTGFNPTAGGTILAATASPFTITGLTAASTYDVYVRTNCTGGGNSAFTGPLAVATPCGPTVVSTFPYSEGFDNIATGQSLPCGITILDANADATTWRVSTELPYSGTRNMRYQGIVASVAANDWFFTPALTLPGTANTRFQVAFRYRAAGTGSTGTSNFTESLEVKSGTAATVAGQTNLLYTNTAINNLAYAQAGGTSTPVVAYLPAGASTQYVGFHVNSAALQGNLYIDDLSVTAVTVTATSETLLRAISVFPNPSTTGLFDLAINGANAKTGLDVEVVNNLGQRVYVGTARDNFTNKLDLSRLATGLYHLKVRNGDEYMLRQISIVK